MEIAERWAEYFEQLLNGEDPEEIFYCIQEQPNNRKYETPTVQEIKTQIKRLKNHKSPDEADSFKPLAENILGDYQGGFRENKSIIDQIFIIRQLAQKTWEFDQESHTLFVDFKKAYESINRESIYKILDFRIPKKLKGLIKATLNRTMVKVKVVLEKVIRMMNISPDEGMKLDGILISILAYADDIVLLGNNINTVKSLCERLLTAARRVGLQINEERTEYMEISRQRYGRQVEDFLKIGPYSFKNVSQFKYLGSMIIQSNNMEYEILKRIQMGNKCYYAMGNLLESRILSKTLKVQLYVTLIRSIILYGTVVKYCRQKSDESKLRVFERKVLRRIYGPCLKEIRRRLEWAGHVWRKPDAMTKTVLQDNPRGKRPLGRPRMRWEDCVKKDVAVFFPEEDWHMLAQNCEGWRHLGIYVCMCDLKDRKQKKNIIFC
ncbi:hypothetical protein QTP88_012370 [Uroleucon formosanum]